MHFASEIMFQLRKQLKLVPKIRSAAVDISIISIDRNITDNINRKITDED